MTIKHKIYIFDNNNISQYSYQIIFHDIIFPQRAISQADILIVNNHSTNIYYMSTPKETMTWAEFYVKYYNFIHIDEDEFYQAVDMACSPDINSAKLGIDLLFKSKIIYNRTKITDMYKKICGSANMKNELIYKSKLHMLEYRNCILYGKI